MKKPTIVIRGPMSFILNSLDQASKEILQSDKAHHSDTDIGAENGAEVKIDLKIVRITETDLRLHDIGPSN
jgi:hypothetical protein